MTRWKIKLFSYVHKKEWKEKWQVALCGHVMIIMWIKKMDMGIGV